MMKEWLLILNDHTHALSSGGVKYGFDPPPFEERFTNQGLCGNIDIWQTPSRRFMNYPFILMNMI